MYASPNLGEHPICYDEPPAFIPEGFLCQLKYRPLREEEEPPHKPSSVKQPQYTGHTSSGKEKTGDDEVAKWQEQGQFVAIRLVFLLIVDWLPKPSWMIISRIGST